MPELWRPRRRKRRSAHERVLWDYWSTGTVCYIGRSDDIIGSFPMDPLKRCFGRFRRCRHTRTHIFKNYPNIKIKLFHNGSRFWMWCDTSLHYFTVDSLTHFIRSTYHCQPSCFPVPTDKPNIPQVHSGRCSNLRIRKKCRLSGISSKAVARLSWCRFWKGAMRIWSRHPKQTWRFGTDTSIQQ